MKNFAASVFLAALSNYSHASLITVEFDVTINSKFNFGTYQSESFTPLSHQTVSMTFDSNLSSVERYWDTNLYPINSHVTSNFGSTGSTSISSPVAELTAINPIINAPVTTTSSMSSVTFYSFAPHQYWEPATVSYAHSFGGSVTYRSTYLPGGSGTYAGESWTRTVGLYSPIEYLGMFSESDILNYHFTSDDLISQLLAMQNSGTAFTFSDQFTYENRPTLLSSGFRYTGSAIITKISGLGEGDIPEPASSMLIGLGILACWSVRRTTGHNKIAKHFG